MAYRTLLAILAFALVSTGIAGASSALSVLASYGVPNSIIANLTITNISYSGHTYATAYDHNTLYFVLNASNSNSIVVGSHLIASIITNVTVSGALTTANFASLGTSMQAYVNSGRKAITSCLQETGLTTGTCTAANSCQSCQSVPACERIYYSTDGVTGSFVAGIMAYEYNYTQANQTLGAYFSGVNSVNASNVGTALPAIASAFSSISTYTHALDAIDINTVPGNLTPDLNNCGFYGSSGGPWYCHDYPYCPFITYNFSLLGSIQGQLNTLNALPLTPSAVLAIAVKANGTESTYVLPVLSKGKKQQLGVILNTTLVQYPSLVNASTLLLTHISNTSLSLSLSNAQKVYSNVTGSYLTENFTKANTYAANAMANLTAVYASVNATYSSLASTSQENTLLLLDAQLDSQNPPGSAAALAFKQLAINSQLSGHISDVGALSTQIQAVHANATAVYSSSSPDPLTETARALDAPFVGMIGYYSGLPYQSNAMLAPDYGAILALIVGIIILLIVYAIYRSLAASQRLVLNRQIRSNWHLLFAFIGVFILLYIVLTYALLTSASAFAPVSSFQGAVSGSQYVAIVENGTVSAGAKNCANELVNIAVALNKKPILASISGGSCTIGNLTETAGYCYNYFAYANVPAVVLTNSANASIKTYSLYGSQLLVSGDSASLNSCYAALLLK